jgi:hypothetical protein
MRPVYRSIAVGVLQCALVLSVAGKYAIDRERLPRAWARVAPVDPNLPVRGRYVSLRVQVEAPTAVAPFAAARLSAVGGQLVATPDPRGTVHIANTFNRATMWSLVEPLAFFIPEHVPDPSQVKLGEELWVEVSVPAKGDPRPVRLGVKREGVLQPLELR